MNPKFTITNAIAAALTRIERARGFLEAATLSDEWVRAMGERALLLEAHHTTHTAIQGVRDAGMDLTGWLEYFVEGLATQLGEVRQRGEQVIRRDILAKDHGLSERQTKALAHVMEHGSLTIQDFLALCPDTNRRTLQRDLKIMLDKGLLDSSGATNRLQYKPGTEMIR